MKIFFLTLFLTVAVWAQSPAEKQVAAAHEAYLVAARAGDTAPLEKLFAEELQYSHSNALLENKQQAIANIAKGKPDFKVHEQSIVVHGNVATVRAKVTAVKNNLPLSILTVWVNNKGKWQLAQRQTTKIVPE